jgi:hypothetical protein
MFCTGERLYKPLAGKVAPVLVKAWLSPIRIKNIFRGRYVGNLGISKGFPQVVGSNGKPAFLYSSFPTPAYDSKAGPKRALITPSAFMVSNL